MSTSLPISNANPVEEQKSIDTERPEVEEQTQAAADRQTSTEVEVLTEFTLVPKLPIEIRLMIWRFAFPNPRPFNLNFLMMELDNTWDHGPDMGVKESIYTFPRVLNPRRDQVHISYSLPTRCPTWTYKLLLELTTKFPKCFNAIKSVDIRDYWYRPIDDPLTRLRASTPGDEDLDTSSLERRELWGGALQLLPGLTNVYITPCRPEEERDDFDLHMSSGNQREDTFGLEEARNHIAKVLALSKKGFLSGKVPEVLVRPWQCLPGVEMPEVGEAGETST